MVSVETSFPAGRLDGLTSDCQTARNLEAGREMAAASAVSQEILNPCLSIEGRRRLQGVLKVSGAKNSALVLMTAGLLTDELVELTNVPNLTDIESMGRILSALGVQVDHSGDTIALNASTLSSHEPPYELVNSLRASFFCIGSLLGRSGSRQGAPAGRLPHRSSSGDRTHPRSEGIGGARQR